MDAKSSGIIGGCILLAGLVIALSVHFQGGNLPQGNVNDHEKGRYQMVVTNGVNVFLVDTKTGRVWQKFVSSNEGTSEWSEQDVTRGSK